MKSTDKVLKVDRRAMLSALTVLPVLPMLLSVPATAQTATSDPLPSWKDTATKKAITAFVERVTKQGSPNYVPEAERIATFDNDGTLWVEQPIYSQVVYCLNRVPAVVGEKNPKLKNVEPFKTVLSGNREAIAKLSLHDLEKILFATLTGMPVEDFETEAKKWLATAKDPRWKRPYTDPDLSTQCSKSWSMLRGNGFKTFIVTGGGKDFVRTYSQQVYGIPTEQVVGTAGGTKFGYHKDGRPFLTKDCRNYSERR